MKDFTKQFEDSRKARPVIIKNEKVSEFRVPGGWIGRPVPEGHVTVQESTGFISDEAWSQ